MNLYIEQGRFGEFVTEILLAEKHRKEEIARKENEDKWWSLYLHSASEKSYEQWKAELTGTANTGSSKQTQGNDANTTNEDVDAIIKRLFVH